MMANRWLCVIVMVGLAAYSRRAAAETPDNLRLVPFPKQIELDPGSFSLSRVLILEAPDALAHRLGTLLADELRRAGMPAPRLGVQASKLVKAFRLGPAASAGPMPELPEATSEEGYALSVRPNEIVCQARGEAGLLYGVQTLCQLIRANRRDAALPCLTIRDWPSLRWRCFQDDMTRGPSSKLETLQREAALGAQLKMNLFTYYMEYQYAFTKHPAIGPKDGSLTPEDLSALVQYAKPLGVDILGNQQSFGHFGRILALPQYAPLRETADVLCPVREDTYRLLDDLYGEVCPLLPFPWFNVCCDETQGLGQGPSKELADKIGVGGVYVGHIRRIHDLLKDHYGKRMMMWGDIILQHPDQLSQVPKDTIMLTWGYDPREEFERQIVPFAKSGYEFFVCPGVNNWSRILPDFGATTTNIRNFVRDGAKHGALGMLNTSWEDDGESLNAPNWHGYAWGAECAWNASTMTPEAFNRRLGAVLFGEKGDHFGQSIELLAQTHRLPDMNGMMNGRFWNSDFVPQAGGAEITASAQRLLALVRPAIAHLEACRQEAVVNGELLDSVLLGARRMERIGQRMLDGLEASRLYAEACRLPVKEAPAVLAKVETLVRSNRDAHQTLGRQFEKLWLNENKPYALDWTMARYASTIKSYDELLSRLASARQQAEGAQSLPSPEAVGLTLPK